MYVNVICSLVLANQFIPSDSAWLSGQRPARALFKNKSVGNQQRQQQQQQQQHVLSALENSKWGGWTPMEGGSNWTSGDWSSTTPQKPSPPKEDPTMAAVEAAAADAADVKNDDQVEEDILAQQDEYDDLISSDDDEDEEISEDESVVEDSLVPEDAAVEEEVDVEDNGVEAVDTSAPSEVQTSSSATSFPARLSQIEVAFFGEATEASSGMCLKDRIEMLELFFNNAISIDGSASFQKRLTYLEENSKGNLVGRLRTLKLSALVGDDGDDDLTGGLEENINQLEMYFFGKTFSDDESGGGGFENRLVNLEKRGNLYVDRLKAIELASVGMSKDTSMKEGFDNLESYFYESIYSPDENTIESRLERLEKTIQTEMPERIAKLEMASLGAVPVATPSNEHDETSCLKASIDSLETFFFGRVFDQSESDGMGFVSRTELLEEHVRDFDERLSRTEIAAFGDAASNSQGGYHKKSLKERSAHLESFFFATKHDGSFETLLERLEDSIL